MSLSGSFFGENIKGERTSFKCVEKVEFKPGIEVTISQSSLVCIHLSFPPPSRGDLVDERACPRECGVRVTLLLSEMER